MNKILPKNIVDKWLKKALSQEYSITVFPKDAHMSEKLVRKIQDEGWKYYLHDGKLVVVSNNPVKIAQLSLSLKKMGYFIQEE